MAIRIAARPALNRKNFTPASRETKASVNAMPTPRCARNRNRTVERDMRGDGRQVGWMGQVGGVGRPAALSAQPALPARPEPRWLRGRYLACKRLLISAQLTTF